MATRLTKAVQSSSLDYLNLTLLRKLNLQVGGRPARILARALDECKLSFKEMSEYDYEELNLRKSGFLDTTRVPINF